MEEVSHTVDYCDPLQHRFNVFVPQSVDSIRVNITPAMSFGQLVPCWEGEQLIHNTFQCSRDIKKSMRNAKPGDYLLCVGDPAVIALCAIVLHDVTGGNYRILKWDRQTRCYYSIVVEMAGIEDE